MKKTKISLNKLVLSKEKISPLASVHLIGGKATRQNTCPILCDLTYQITCPTQPPRCLTVETNPGCTGC